MNLQGMEQFIAVECLQSGRPYDMQLARWVYLSWIVSDAFREAGF